MGGAYVGPVAQHPGRRQWHLSLLLAPCIALLLACEKDSEPGTAPPIQDFRTFERVTVVVKDDANGGHVLLCKQVPSDRVTSHIQLLGADGTLQSAIPFDALPRRIENIDFLPEDLLFTDVQALADGSLVLVGTGLQSALDERLHLVMYRMTHTGDLLGDPIRRYITDHAEVITVPPTEPRADPDGLPRQRALIAPLDEGLVVAARWETEDAAGIRLWWFPAVGGAGAVTSTDLPLQEFDDRLLQCAADPSTGHVVLVVDQGTTGGHHQTRLVGFNAANGTWAEPEECLLPGIDLEPQQLVFQEGAFLLVGYRPSDGLIRPVISRFQTVASAASGMLDVSDPSSVGDPLAAYCGWVRNGRIRLALQHHASGAEPPWFTGDLTSDLVIADLDANAAVTERQVLLPGQGLRAIDLSGTEPACRIIGSMHPYLNAGYEHTFFLVPDQ